MEGCPVFCAGVTHDDYAKSLDALPSCFDRAGVFQVPCQRKSPGWYGALVCNQQICRQALEYFNTHPSTGGRRRVYVSLEAQARPTLRFSRAALQEVIESFRASTDSFIHISVIPLPMYGWPRRHVYSKVFKQRGSLCQLSTAMLCSQEFAQTISDLDVDNVSSPFDIFLAESGYSRLVMYPAAFQRSNGPSLASKTPALDAMRAVLGNKYVFVAGECFCHYSGTFLSLFFIVVVVVIVALFLRKRAQ